MRPSSSSATTPTAACKSRRSSKPAASSSTAGCSSSPPGQSALSGTPQLQKLRDRFRVPVQLSDTDVEAVIRKVITAKKPDKASAIKAIVSAHEGEITRHLTRHEAGVSHRRTRLAYIPDYPLLPVRRRFWEHVLRAVDVAGTAAQLRNQLGIVYESVRAYADRSAETVVGGDFIYWVKATDLLQTGSSPAQD